MKKLKSELNATQHKLNRANCERDMIKEQHEELKLKSAIAKHKPSTIDAAVQTDGSKTGATFVETMDWEHINRRAEKYKKAYGDVVTSYNELREKYGKLISNENGVTAYNALKLKYDQLKVQYDKTAKTMSELESKYGETKRICNARFEKMEEYERKIADYKQNVATLNSELGALNQINEKYEQLKSEAGKAATKPNEMAAYNDLKVKYQKIAEKCQETAELLDEIKQKYGLTKQIANKRFEEIQKFKQMIANFEKNEMELKSELEALKTQLDVTNKELTEVKAKNDRAKGYLIRHREEIEKLAPKARKYEDAKDLLERRRLEILRLMALVEGKTENHENNENVPINE